jgi:LysR family transcriptional regulator, cell division regulator
LEAVLAARGIVGLRRLEFGTIDGILGCVAAGIGVTLLPCRERVAVHEVPATQAQVDTVFIRRRDSFSSRALTALLEHAHPAPMHSDAAE